MRGDKTMSIPLRIALGSLLTLVLVGSGPSAVGVQGSDEQTGLTITMTGETGELQFDLTVSSGEGGVVEVPGEGVFTYDAGTVVELKATADDGFRFAGWTGDTHTIISVDAAETKITVDADYSITAIFNEDSLSPSLPVLHDLVVTSTVGGNVTVPGEGRFEYEVGAVVDLEAEPGEGFRFLEWTGDVSTVADATSGVTSIIMYGEYHILASFDEVPAPALQECPWWWILVGIVIAGLLVYFLWWRRRRRRVDSGPQE